MIGISFGNDTPTTLQADELDALGRVATRHLGGASSADALTSVAYGYDPMAEKYYHLSPLAYCDGNPIRYVDPSGMEWKTPEDKALAVEIDLQLNKKIEDAAKKLAKINKKISENTKKNKNNDKNIKNRI